MSYLAVNSSKLSSPCGSCASVARTALVENAAGICLAPIAFTPALCIRKAVDGEAEGEEKSLARATRAKAAEDMVSRSGDVEIKGTEVVGGWMFSLVLRDKRELFCTYQVVPEKLQAASKQRMARSRSGASSASCEGSRLGSPDMSRETDTSRYECRSKSCSLVMWLYYMYY